MSAEPSPTEVAIRAIRSDERARLLSSVERLYSSGRPGACACPPEDQRECGYRKGIGDALAAMRKIGEERPS